MKLNKVHGREGNPRARVTTLAGPSTAGAQHPTPTLPPSWEEGLNRPGPSLATRGQRAYGGQKSEK